MQLDAQELTNLKEDPQISERQISLSHYRDFRVTVYLLLCVGLITTFIFELSCQGVKFVCYVRTYIMYNVSC